MCLAIPGKIESFDHNSSPKTGKVDFGGIRKTVCFEILPDSKIGDYVLVHVGFAISLVDEKDAQETLRILREVDELNNELNGE